MEGKVLGNRYELIEKIGGGGMALVYKARCRFLNRFVAIKILRSEFTNDEEFVRRFRIEAQSAASLSDSNIVSIYDVGDEGDIYYIVMEYIDGITLKEHITKNGALHWKDAVEISIQICCAIEHAHENNIIHRDIKPHNILITKDGIAKVTDFGIARAVSSSTITMIGSTIGSVHYFSPEQARGSFTDEKSDIYSLGVVLYEMITGKVPFNGDTPVAVALKHIQVEPKPPKEINKEIPIGINSIVINAIKKDQSQRYQTAFQMLDDLYKVLDFPDKEYNTYIKDDEFPTKRVSIVGDTNIVNVSNSIKNLDKNHVNIERRKDKISIGLAIATSVVIIGLIVFFVITKFLPIIGMTNNLNNTNNTNNTTNNNSINKEFVIEDYVGRNFNEVKKELAQNNIAVRSEIRKFDEKIPKDIIISQNRLVGEKLKIGGYGATIDFDVSDGPLMIRIPDLRKVDYRQAENELRDKKLSIDIIDEFSDTVPIGFVIKTEPENDTEVRQGSTIKIYRSKGVEQKFTIVPDIVGKTRAEAFKILADSKLTVGKIYPEEDNGILDEVEKQEPLSTKKVLELTPIDIYFKKEEIVLRKRKFSLVNPEKYSNKINVTIEVIYPNTQDSEYIMKDVQKYKSDFPINFTVKVPDKGKAKVRIFLDNELYTEFLEDLT